MKEDEFDAQCKELLYMYCEIRLSSNKTIKGFVLPEDYDESTNRYECSMGNMRVPIRASKTISIKLLKKGN